MSDLIKRLLSLADCDARYGEPLGKVMREAALDARWQPIETAPKNTAIWACDAVRGYDGKVISSGPAEWMCVNFNQFGMDIGFYPTHWMPLPTPPRAQS